MKMLILQTIVINLIIIISSLLCHCSPTPLLEFFQSLPHPSQQLLDWNQSFPECSWPGITCTSTNTIHSLNLTGLGITGTLSTSIPHLCYLPSLVTLDITSNHFSGPIPPQLGNCSKLQTIILAQNQLNGTIPPELFLSGLVIMLDLGCNSITGPIPPEVKYSTLLNYAGFNDNLLTGEIPRELFLLPKLTYLYISSNNLTGTLPDFPSCCVIAELYVYQNSLSGEVTTSLFNCHNLTTLYASSNQLEGKIPDLFLGLPLLQQLYLDGNMLEGEIPRSLQSLGSLEKLHLYDNRFSGTIPEQIGNCKSLIKLSLWGNYLTGPVPASIGELTSLLSLRFSQNQLSGSLPPALGNCSSLVEIELHENNFTGSIPLEIYQLKNLQKLRLFNNNLEGIISPEIAKLSNLIDLQLYNNSFSGSVPEEIALLKNLQNLSLAFNKLTGEMPYALGKNTVGGLRMVDLTGNAFFGSLPPYLCEGNKMTILVVGWNRFNGCFPAEISSCQSLKRVILGNNQFRGNIPYNLSVNPSISYLDLSNNLFVGNIPPTLGSWHNLSMLDLSNNLFNGFIPTELGSLHNLQSLRIASNRLTGTIPPELGNCTKLSRLDLSWNFLEGGIPVKIMSVNMLQNLLLSGNRLTGQIPDSFTTSQNLLELQLGDNMLEGHIPSSLGNLQYIYLSLNLSNNRLIGGIPASFGNLDKLQVLDLSNNSLSGQVPSDLISMISLSVVNLSFNQLSGSIPLSWVKFANSSPGSFLGNPNLITHPQVSVNKNHNRKSRQATLVSVVAACVLLILVGIFFSAKYLADSKVGRLFALSRASTRGLESSSRGLPEDLTYEDILRVTEDFSETYVIGRGRHGTVYKTEFDKGKCWAVKKVNLSDSSFFLEMKILNVVRHRNLVKMAGYCIRGGFGMILYEYMAGGTLFDVLHQRRHQIALDWKARRRIALGIAQGLSYLHHDCVPQIIHRDIKSDNILMDSEFEPKIGDFGIAKMIDDGPDENLPMSLIIGTLGYIAPENGYSTRLTEKADIYSYGVILLELLCRKLPVDPSFEDGVDIVAWMRERLKNVSSDIVFESLDEEILYWMKGEKEKALQLLELAMTCTQPACQARPSMREVVSRLIKL